MFRTKDIVSPDTHEELLEEFENSRGAIDTWLEADMMDFVQAATGVDPIKVSFNKKMFSIDFEYEFDDETKVPLDIDWERTSRID